MKRNYFVFLLIFFLLISLFTIVFWKSLNLAGKNQASVPQPKDDQTQTAGMNNPVTKHDIPITVTNPQDQEEVNGNSLVVRGTTIPNAYISVNDNDSRADDNGRFSLVIPLEKGANSVVVVASDLSGDTSEIDLSVRANY